MNSKEAQNDLERMVASSLELRLGKLGVSEAVAQEVLHHLDFDAIRGYLSMSEEELKTEFAHLLA